jgi:hypothetical protein
MYVPLLFMLLAPHSCVGYPPRHPRLRDLVLLLATVPAALRSMRHIPILMLVLVPVLAGSGRGVAPEKRGAERLLRVGDRRPPCESWSLTFWCWLLLLVTPLRVRQVVRAQEQTEARHFPRRRLRS